MTTRIGVNGKELPMKVSEDAVLVLFGFKPAPGPIAEWDLEMEKGHFDGKIKLIATGYGEAAQAVKSAIGFAYPERKVKTVFSSVQGPPSKRK